MPLTFADELPNILPKFMPLYHFSADAEKWVPFPFSTSKDIPAGNFHILTWNLNCNWPHRKERLREVIRYLEEDIFPDLAKEKGAPPPCVLCFQEVHKVALKVLLRRQWIRDHFLVTPVNPESWPQEISGLVTVISKAIPVSRAFIIDLPMSTLDRQALFVDLHLKGAVSGEGSSTSGGQRIHALRIANTHLEVGGTITDSRAREKQLKHIARMLNVPNLNVAICVGSLGACRDDDAYVIAEAGFADAYTGKQWASETWGVQPESRSHVPARMDRVLYFPAENLHVEIPKRIGLGASIRNETSYVSDHLGVRTVVKI